MVPIRIRMAPLNVPMKRRLQTAAVLLHGFTIPLYTSLFWFLLAIPLTWPILLPYLLYCLFSEAHLDGSAPRRRSPFLRSLPLWRLYTDYFPLKLHATTALDPAKNYIFTYHPHGIISHGAFGHFCTEHTTGFEALFPGITNTLLTLDSNFRVPFYRDFLLLMGLASVSRRSCEALLRGEAAPRPSSPNSTPASSCSLQQQYTAPSGGGRAITIVLGGARESLEAIPGRMALVVKRRRGVLKIAIRENAGLVPVLSFGENELYEQVVPAGGGVVARLQMFVKRVAGFTVPLFHARGVFNYDVGLLPYRREVNTVVGRPVFPRAQMESPRDGDVEELQERYLAELRRLWEEHKDVYARGRLPGKEGEMVFVG
ncbi:diacylglycerol acyltransferase [Morchella conica CCBAS932]|uniref:Diacylglycerol O-acyltransferase n=1 Tax=Morchella conica CCBAS932 TaxID=1392247 RepID=A0A3N4L247_9PEZI|nr:diacylglycerol acyltransferase [Morchella conica CCBAS932]